MAMKELQHAAHECLLTSLETVENGICNICYKDEPVEFACITCNFDLCKSCSNLPPKVSHEFHAEHPLEFCLQKLDQETKRILCSCCGCLSSESFYKCKECEIYLDLSCAVLPNIFRSWDDDKKFHYSHAHILKRCRPGPDARGSCLLCELPLSPSAICYGCVPCFLFVHERCLDFPMEIQHPMHPAHPLRRFDYTQNCGSGISCYGCGKKIISSVPIGCLECRFYLHMRCADSLLRGLMHKSHEHKLFYCATRDAVNVHCGFMYKTYCNICKRKIVTTLESYYQCMELECLDKIHFKCLEIPQYVVKKKFHIHPLVCKLFICVNDSLQYCGVCETMMRIGNHAYSCEECDFLGHIECILRKEPPSPFYLKDLYSCGKDVARGNKLEECVTNKLDKKLMVNDIGHIHVLRLIHNELDHYQRCDICKEELFGSSWNCEPCRFVAHDYCANLGKPSRHQLHLNHDLTLLPSCPAGFIMNCNNCKVDISSFNLFCRICSLTTCMSCVVRFNKFLGVSHRGQKFIGATEVKCNQDWHRLLQVLVSSSYQAVCTICDESLCGKVVSCVECVEIYHPRCVQFLRLEKFSHPIHSDHKVKMMLLDGSKCISCKLDITKYGLFCFHCEVSFHIKCSEAVDESWKYIFHKHTFYNFWIADSRVTRGCCVCGRPCGASFYGCIDCNFIAHVECLGFPANVKSQLHQHTVLEEISWQEEMCVLCRSNIESNIKRYSCKHCKDIFHKECIISKDDRKAATEAQQLGDIYFMYIERFLLNMFEEEKEEEKLKGKTKIELLIARDESATEKEEKIYEDMMKYNYHNCFS